MRETERLLEILGDWSVSVHDLVSIYPAVRSRREGNVDRRGKTEERWGFKAKGKWTVSPGRVADHACEHWASHDRRLFDCTHPNTPPSLPPFSFSYLLISLPDLHGFLSAWHMHISSNKQPHIAKVPTEKEWLREMHTTMPDCYTNECVHIRWCSLNTSCKLLSPSVLKRKESV